MQEIDEFGRDGEVCLAVVVIVPLQAAEKQGRLALAESLNRLHLEAEEGVEITWNTEKERAGLS